VDRHNAIRVGAVVEGQAEDQAEDGPVGAQEAGSPLGAACAPSVWNT
jgi:hypothetical protein